MLKLIDAGIQVEVQHHEVGTAGQAEIDMRFGTLAKMGDQMMVFKYVIKNVAAQHGYVATFMPKPLFQDNGSGMHVHQSLWKDGENLFADAKGYAGLSQTADHELVPQARTGLRGADQPGVLAAQPVRLRAHPGLLHQPEVEAR